MLTKMTDTDWGIVVAAFQAARSRRGEKGRDDRKFLEALHFFTVHNITWRALPAEFGNWNSVWKRFWRLSQRGVFEAMLALLAGMSGTAHLVQMFDSVGLPLAFHLTGGEASDSRNFAILLDIGPDITPRAVLGDKGYDARANREAARRRGICPAIPYRENAADKPAFFPKILYKGRARAEQGVGKIKRFKRIALRCEKTAQNFAAFISLACTFILVKSVHTT